MSIMGTWNQKEVVITVHSIDQRWSQTFRLRLNLNLKLCLSLNLLIRNRDNQETLIPCHNSIFTLVFLHFDYFDCLSVCGLLCHDRISLWVNDYHFTISKNTQEIYWVWSVRNEWHCWAWGLNFSRRLFVWTFINWKYRDTRSSICKIECLCILLEMWGGEFTWNSFKNSIKSVSIKNLHLIRSCNHDVIFELTNYSCIITDNLFDFLLFQLFFFNFFL